jgi:hypothetical protein
VELSFRLLAAAIGLLAVVLPRLPHIRPAHIAGGIILGPFSAGLLDGNVRLMSVLLVAFAAILTWLRPMSAWQSAVILAFAPAIWMVIVMVLHGPGDIWPIALVLAIGYGAVMALVGFGVGKLAARISNQTERQVPH